MARATGVPINRINRESLFLPSVDCSQSCSEVALEIRSLSHLSFYFISHRVRVCVCLWLCVRKSADSIRDEWILKWTPTNCCVNKVKKPFHPVNSLWTSLSFCKATREALYHFCLFSPPLRETSALHCRTLEGIGRTKGRASADCFFFSTSLSLLFFTLTRLLLSESIPSRHRGVNWAKRLFRTMRERERGEVDGEKDV